MTRNPTACSLHPNPACSQVGLKTPEATHIRILDTQGRTVLKVEPERVTQSEYLVPVDELPNGLYLLRVQQRDGSQATERLVVQH
jgi:hypothetical protein